MQIRYLPNNVEKELSGRFKIVNGNEKECQSIIRIDGEGNEKEIWANAQAIYLGNGKSFDLSSFSGYQNFTDDNFFFDVSDTQYDVQMIGRGESGTIYAQINKSYNASTGALSFYFKVRSQYNSKIYLVKNPSKLIPLGTAQSFNIGSLAPNVDYTKLTADNFVVKTLPRQVGTKECYSSSCDLGAGYTKSYNASAGVLTWYCRGSWADSNPVTAYLVKNVK